MNFSKNQLEMIKLMAEDTLFSKVRQGVDDINWVIDMTDIYKQADIALGKLGTKTYVKSDSDLDPAIMRAIMPNTNKPRVTDYYSPALIAAVTEHKKDYKSPVIKASEVVDMGDLVQQAKEKLFGGEDRIPKASGTTCCDCADYKKSCRGFEFEKCRYNEELAGICLD